MYIFYMTEGFSSYSGQTAEVVDLFIYSNTLLRRQVSCSRLMIYKLITDLLCAQRGLSLSTLHIQIFEFLYSKLPVNDDIFTLSLISILLHISAERQILKSGQVITLSPPLVDAISVFGSDMFCSLELF